MVTFLLSNQEYAFPIEVVSEVLRVGKITRVPRSPGFVVGILTVRDSVLPIIDNRRLFGMESLVEELDRGLDLLLARKKEWFAQLRRSLDEGTTFRGNRSAALSELGVWIEEFRTVSQEIGAVTQELRYLNLKLHEWASRLLDQAKEGRGGKGAEQFDQALAPVFSNLLLKLEQLRGAIRSGIHEDQRVVVVEAGAFTIGLLVDRVQQVLRVAKATLEEPPAILSDHTDKTLAQIAKLDGGRRVIMLLDQRQLFGTDQIKAIEGMDQQGFKKQSSASRLENDDVIQLVTFRLGTEQFAIGIEEVREINRLETVTAVPQAPHFIEGVMNLRGNVIPVVNLRKRFRMGERQYDSTTKVIIVSIGGRFTGLIVDAVSEVLRIPRRLVESVPPVLSGGVETDFLKGICKNERDGQMLLLVWVDRILSTGDKVQLEDTLEQHEP